MADIINWADNNSGITEPITITLEGEGSTSVDFQQAFGDFSEARGRRRERRRARRQERKMRRIARRMARKKARLLARLERKRMRQEARDSRRGSDEEESSEEQPSSESSSSTPSDSGSSDSSAPSDTPTAEPSSAPSEDSGENDTAEEEQAVEQETGASDEESGFTGDYGFDGQRQPSELDTYWDNFYSSAEGQESINPRVVELSRRIEKNKELAKHIEARIVKINARIESGKAFRGDSNLITMLNTRLGNVRNRIAEMENKLAGYSRFVGEYSEASGGQWRENARKRAEVRRAKRLARKERQNFIRAKRKARIQELMGQFVAQGMSRPEARLKARAQAKAENPFKETAVDSSLNATISPNKIDIPASNTASSFNGTGLIGLDNYNDFDAPPTRNVEIDFSNASGSMKGNWKWIAIGVVVAVGGIIAYNKWIKKK